MNSSIYEEMLEVGYNWIQDHLENRDLDTVALEEYLMEFNTKISPEIKEEIIEEIQNSFSEMER